MTGRILTLTACLAGLLGLVACGSGNGSSAELLQPEATGQAEHGGLKLDGLKLLDGSMLDEQATRGISVQWSVEDGQPVALIHGEEVAGLKALYFSVEHATDLSALSIEAGDWTQGSSLEMAVTPEAGHSEAGVVLTDPLNREGFSGSGLLATLHFGEGDGEVKAASDAPKSEASRTKLYLAPDLFLLYWFYNNPGDYDQNGLVSISDLTPLAINFGKQSMGGFNFTSAQSVVDGDGNGVINISDISPIGINFGNAVTSYDMYIGQLADYPASATDPVGGTELESWEFSEANGIPSKDRLYFNEQLQVPLPAATGAWLHPASGGSLGIASTVVGFGNQAPIANVEIDKQTGVVPFSLSADASQSTDPDGDELSFQWVLGDEITLFTSKAILDPADDGDSFATEVSNPGRYKLVLVVRDPQGAVDFVLEDILATEEAGWEILDIDMTEQHSNLQEMQDIDLCEVDGKPLIGYSFKVGGTGSHVYMMQGESLFDGNGWMVSDIVTGQSPVDYTEVAVAEINGTGAVAAAMKGTGVSFAYFGRLIENGEPEIFNEKLFEQTADGLSGIDMVYANGQAMVAYRNEVAGTLRFAFALDSGAQNWIGPANVGITGAPSSQISMQVINGAPAFAYWAGGSSLRLRYHDAAMNGQVPVFDNGTTLRILNSGYMSDALVALADGSPAVFYQIPSETAIHGFHADDEFATMWNDNGEVSAQNAVATEYCAGLHAGVPALAWYNVLTAELYYQRATDATDTAWEDPELVDGELAIGTRPTMADINGSPALAWIDKGRNVVSYGVRVE